MKKIMVWLAPMIIILTAVSILFLENYQEVTQPADDNWSRGLKVGTTPFTQEPFVHQTEDGQLSVAFLTDEGVQQNIYNEHYELASKEKYKIPLDKFTSIYLNNGKLIYANYYSMFDGETDQKIEDISEFYPLKGKLLYKKENQLFLLHTDNMESTPLLQLDNENASLLVDESKQGIHIIKKTVSESGNTLTFYKLNNEGLEEVGSASLRVKSSEEIKDLQFTTYQDNYYLLLSTTQKQSSSGKMTNFYYYSKSPIGEQPNLKQVSFNDPYGSGELEELSDIEMKMAGKDPVLLFKAYGSTKTTFKEPKQFNIYKSELRGESSESVKRLSNTPNSSSEPVWLDDEAIVWIDHGGEQTNRIYLASSDPEVIKKADGMTQSSLVLALGKTLGMLSYSFLAAVISIIWFIWPLLFIVVVTFANNRALDRDHSWIFYTGALIYLAASLLFKRLIFTDAVMASAPGYLSFTGSSFIYIIGLALVSLVILKIGSKVRDWSTLVQLSYFIGIHVAFITVFFGPYLI
ncbi:DUF2975 domain-containing protein [Halobacillus sp. BBL2006]|uniref:DUF2975 domain-containing protein n=1 Tax=Halobacillus sp. BBL2006 TaxID=1543706 RepID=UPI0005435552|nr:DUF2975 domain-containing protein [Halobacillus sp. BBL2006]KHE68698.1 hypothetical protein LD39_14095 [Halobacillus sp. BBL2006]